MEPASTQHVTSQTFLRREEAFHYLACMQLILTTLMFIGSIEINNYASMHLNRKKSKHT